MQITRTPADIELVFKEHGVRIKVPTELRRAVITGLKAAPGIPLVNERARTDARAKKAQERRRAAATARTSSEPSSSAPRGASADAGEGAVPINRTSEIRSTLAEFLGRGSKSVEEIERHLAPFFPKDTPRQVRSYLGRLRAGETPFITVGADDRIALVSAKAG